MNKETNTILSVRDLSVKAPKTQRYILQDINFDIKPGDFIVILGSNGSGKSSLIKAINKTYQNFRGKINFGFKNCNIKNISSRTYSKYVSTITQDIDANLFMGLTVLENCILYESKYKNSLCSSGELNLRNKYKDYLEKYNAKLSSKLDTCAAKLSGGEKQSLILALTFLHTPTILLLDEHTSALDPVTGDRLMQFTADKIAEKKITCVMTTHSLTHALKYGNKIIALKNGKIIFHADAKKKIKLNRKNLIKYCY